MKTEQWFQPGDKVMRVSKVRQPRTIPGWRQDIKFGVVYCVETCFRDQHTGNIVMGLVGVPFGLGTCTANFRKVEEIQLCVRAAAQIKAPQTQEVPA